MDLQTLSERVGEELQSRNWSLATAESCTGGQIGQCITAVAGSSHYYLGGVIAYDNAVKVALLGVSESSLESHGAVSDVVALEMATGVRERLGADCAVSTTGIAGPGGGTSEKPVGLVFVAVETPVGRVVRRCRFDGNRAEIRQSACKKALKMILEQLDS